MGFVRLVPRHRCCWKGVKMETQLELMTFTKGITYLLALAFLFGFVAFWQWQQHRGRGLAIRVIPMVVVSFSFLFLVSTCVGTPATATSAAPKAPSTQDWPSVDDAHYLANTLGPAKFAAHEMGPDVVSCQTCHHHSDQPKPCSDCHSEPFSAESPNMPGLKAAYHQKCTQCHTEALNGPMTCVNCHSENPEAAEVAKDQSPSPATPPAISHPLLDRYANCFACHVAEGPLPLPGNHSEYRANVVCLGCHKPSSGNQMLSFEVTLPEPQPAAAAPAAPAEQPATTQAAGPAKVSHPVAGREDCADVPPGGKRGRQGGASGPRGQGATIAARCATRPKKEGSVTMKRPDMNSETSMKTSRRGFLKGTAAIAGTLLASGLITSPEKAFAAGTAGKPDWFGMLTDMTRCAGAAAARRRATG